VTRLSRRRLFGWAGAGAALAGVGAVTGCSAPAAAPALGAEAAVPFRGPHQAGIVTPAQDRLHFVALDLTTDDRERVAALLRKWTAAAERMVAGAETTPGGAVNRNPDAPPDDTGEALGLPASALTLTFGVGAGLVEKLGLGDRMPPGLAPLPAFTGDQLDPAASGGDLCIQACAQDPQVAVHAVRNLVRMGFGTTAVRWSQLGFGRTSSTSTAQATPRNLFGFKDGTRNLKAEDGAELDRHVWVQPGDGPAWLDGGTYLVARRIRMHIEIWDRTSLSEQERIIGRNKGEGAPLGRTAEFDEPDFAAVGADGGPAVPAIAHVRLASPEHLGGTRILRRGYNFVDGSDGQGHLDAGLFFVAFMRDPHGQFVPMQSALANNDDLMEYIEHTGSAVFACPAGLAEGAYWGQALLEG
jgi:deferrochelatase/peroxidase EfeB